VEYAEELCKAFGLELPSKLIQTYESQHEANPTNHYKGLFLNKGTKFPISGVPSLDLSDFITEKIVGYYPSSEFIGRGFGAQANSIAVMAELSEAL